MMALSCSLSSNEPALFASKPIDLAVSTAPISVGENKSAQVVFVADQVYGTVGMIHVQDDRYLDLRANDSLGITPIVVGHEPMAITLYAGGSVPRVFVATKNENALVAFDVHSSTHIEYVDFSSPKTGHFSKPIFKDQGRFSNPTFVNPAVSENANCETWKMKFKNLSYEVKGSQSGLDPLRASEDTLFTSVQGHVQFSIASGGDPVDSGDEFLWPTCVFSELSLPGVPVDLKTWENKIVVVMNDPAQVMVLSAQTGAVESTLAIPAVVLGPDLGKGVLVGDKLYLPDALSEGVHEVDLTLQSVQTLPVGQSTQTLGYNETENELALISSGNRLAFWHLGSSMITDEIELRDKPLGYYSFISKEKAYGLITSASGENTLVDAASKTRIDIDDKGGEDARISEPEFFDAGAKSAPLFLGASFVSAPVSERWVLVFEGYLAQSEPSVITGNTLQSVGALFQTQKVAAGDHVQVGEERIAIQTVVDEETLTLVSAPSVQGSTLVDIKANQSYVVKGSRSGVQLGRAYENVPFSVDDGSFKVTLRSDPKLKTTSGDYFTFELFDGVNTLFSQNEKQTTRAVIFNRTGEDFPSAYVIAHATGGVLKLNLKDLRLKAVIKN